MKLTSGMVDAEMKEPIGWLIWDNQPKLNALSPSMYPDALTVIESFEADPTVKVVVMRGAGKRAFISGADISSFAKTRADADTMERARAASDKLRHVMLHMEKPLIAMVRGYCLGGGLGMALNADIRFASSDSQFGIPAAHRGAVDSCIEVFYQPAGPRGRSEGRGAEGVDAARGCGQRRLQGGDAVLHGETPPGVSGAVGLRLAAWCATGAGFERELWSVPERTTAASLRGGM
jgi:hypothetical protein